MKPQLSKLKIRTELRPGDIGRITLAHGRLYSAEFGHGMAFEAYVAEGLAGFYRDFEKNRDRVWIAEDENRFAGCIFLQAHGRETAQLRYYLVHPDYRRLGLGKLLMEKFMNHFRSAGFRRAYLWTTHELKAAAHLYMKYGFRFSEEKPSTAFGKSLVEQRYDLILHDKTAT